MSTETLDRTDTDTEAGHEPPREAHYARKDAITYAAIYGGLVKALCGKEFEVTQDVKGRPVCKVCTELLNLLPPGDDE